VFNSIQKRLLVYILLITTFFLSGISILNYFWAQNMVASLSEEKASAMADAAAARVEGYLLQKGENAWTLAQNEQIHAFIQKVSTREVDLSQDRDYHEMMTSFQRIVTLNPDIKFVYVGVAKTNRLYANTEFKYPPSYKVSVRPWYKAAAQAKTLVYTSPYVCPLTGNYVVTASAPIYGDSGELLGVAAVDLPVDKLQEIIGDVRILDTGHAFLLDNNGVAIAHPSSTFYMKSFFHLDHVSPDMKRIAQKMVKGQTGMEKVTIGNIDNYILYTPISSVGWSVGVVVPVDEVRHSVYILGRVSLITVIVGMIVICFLIIMLTSRITRPLNEFTELMKQVEEGDYTVRAKVEGTDEVGRLGHSLNHMLDKQQQLIEQVITAAYRMGVVGHELAITMGEARATVPVVTAEIGELIDKQYIQGELKSTDLSAQSRTIHEFMERLIEINHTCRAVLARLESLESLLGADDYDEVQTRMEQLQKGLSLIGEELLTLCNTSEELQMDYVDTSNTVGNICRNFSDIITTLQKVHQQLSNISRIQCDSINRATQASLELVRWSQSLLQITSRFNIHPPLAAGTSQEAAATQDNGTQNENRH